MGLEATVGGEGSPAGFWTEGGAEAAAEEVTGAATTLEGVRSSVGMAMICTPMPPVGTSGTPGTAAPGGETAAAAPGGPLAAPRACPGEPAGQTVTVTGAAPLDGSQFCRFGGGWIPGTYELAVTVTVTVLFATTPASAAPTVTVWRTVTVAGAWFCLFSTSSAALIPRALSNIPCRLRTAACLHVSISVWRNSGKRWIHT